MSFEQLRIPGLVLAGVVVIASGFWLTRAGRPYPIALVTAHKAAALAAIVIIGMVVYQASRVTALPRQEVILVAVAAACVVATFASGAVVSATEAAPAWARWMHRTTPYLAVALSSGSAYFALTHL